MAMHEIQTISAYRSVAREAKRASKIDEEVREDGRRSLLVSPIPTDVHARDFGKYVTMVREKAKKDWLERSDGTGVGYWT